MLLIASVAIYTYSPFAADDAYIVVRYAQNLATGHGLVYNAGEYVSALTSPAEALILAALTGWPYPALMLYKCLCAVSVVSFLSFVSYRAFADPISRALFFALTVISPFVLMWTVGGLETPLLLIVVTSLALLCNRPIDIPAYRRATLLAAIGFLIRYDSVLFSAPIILSIGWHLHRRKPLLALHSWPLFLPIGWLIFAYNYYGDIFPTSFYIKTPHFGLNDLLKGAGYEASALAVSGAWLLAPFIARNLNRQQACTRAVRSEHAFVALAAAIGLVLVYGLSASTKHMMFGYRLLVPYLPSVALVLIKLAPQITKLAIQWLVLAITALNVSMIVVVWLWTVNPTLVTPWRLYEYSNVGLRSYIGDFFGGLDHNARAIVTHWKSVSTDTQRVPRISTYASGRVPFLIPDAYIYEALVSYRKNCSRQWAKFADYTMILYPRHGDRQSQLGELLMSTGQLIDDRAVPFDGALQHFEVWYNPRPSTFILPIRTSDPCLEQ